MRALALVAVAAAQLGAASAATNGTLADPHIHSEPKGTFDERNEDHTAGDYARADYGPNEDVWFRVAPCGVRGDCQVLIWFDSFLTATADDNLGLLQDELVVYDGAAPPTEEELALGCDEAESCLALLAGNDGSDPYGEVKTTEILGTAIAGTPLLLRSRSPVVWLHWRTTDATHMEGFELVYKTDRPSDAQLRSLSLEHVTGEPVDMKPPSFFTELHHYEAFMPEATTQLQVTTAPLDAPIWSPWVVTHPVERAGEVVTPCVLTVNGQEYEESMVITLDNELEVQPLVVSVRAMDNQTYLDYVVNVGVPQGEATGNSTDLLETAVKPASPSWDVGSESGGWVLAPIEPSSLTVGQGDTLRFSMMTGTSLWLMPVAGCPTPPEYPLYMGTPLATYLDSPFELELDEPGTLYFAGGTLADCQTGQHMAVEVVPDLGLTPNEPATAKFLTRPRVAGADLPSADQPLLTGTQWTAEPVWSLSGWDGFHEWFAFHTHHGEQVTITISLGENVYYAVANIWDRDLTMHNATGSSSETEWGGAREFQVTWKAPLSGVYYLSVRTFLADVKGLRFGNYSALYQSDWVDICEESGLDCGEFGTCEAVEQPAGVFKPRCVCTHRFIGEKCDVEPAAPMVILLRLSSGIQGAVDEAGFKHGLSDAVRTAAPRLSTVEPSSIEVSDLTQRVTAWLNLPGDPVEYDADSAAGREARAQLKAGLGTAFRDRMAAECQADISSCEVEILNVSDYLDTHSLRKPPAPNASDTAYWPNPADPACHEYRCYDPACVDPDVTAWRPFGLQLNPFAGGNGTFCATADDGTPAGVALNAEGGTLNFVPTAADGFGLNQECLFRLECPLEHVAEVEFASFDVEPKDFVKVIDGSGTATGVGSVLEELTGTLGNLPSRIYTTASSVMSIEYTSDGIDESTGFSATYRCVAVSEPAPPPPPLFEQNCKEMVQIAEALGISCDDPVSTFINGQADGLLLRDVCRATCGACIPYLGAHASIVQVEVRTATDVAGVIGSASFPALLAEGINATGSQIQSFSNNVSLIAREVGLADYRIETRVDYVVTIGHALAEEAQAVSVAVQTALNDDAGATLPKFLNEHGGAATGSAVLALQIDAGNEAGAAALAEVLIAESSRLSALASDGDAVPVRWFSPQDAVSVEAIHDSLTRVYESLAAQRNARAAAELLIAAGQARGANRLTTVARAAAAAEMAAANVLGMELQIGDSIQDGFNTYVHDVSATAGGRLPDNTVVGTSAVGSQSSDFSQFGDSSRAAVAAAASAAAARLVATGADDIHPLDDLAPILSQAPSSQSFSDDPELPSSTSRFSAQTDSWWIPDYLPGGRPPEQPDPPVVVSYTDSTVRLEWKAPFDWGIPIKGYVLEMRSCEVLYTTQSASECDAKDKDHPGVRTEYMPTFPTHVGTGTTHEVMNLEAGRMYFFHVRAFNVFDQYLSPNNYGVFSYDSLAVTTWRVADRIPPPVPHKVDCVEPLDSAGAVVMGLDEVSHFKPSEPRLRAKANCSIHLSWVQPFSGAVENPLVDRTADIRANDIVNYRIFYYATPAAPPLNPAPDSWVDQNGTEWLEVPHPPQLRHCETDYSEPCPEGWRYHEDVEYGINKCWQQHNTNGTGVCGSPQIYDTFTLSDKMDWEELCNASWAQRCEVATEATLHGLEDTTEYYFIVTALNLGRPGAVDASYHPTMSYGDGVAVHGNNISADVGAGRLRGQPATKVYGAAREFRQVYGEGDFSEPSQIPTYSIRAGSRVLARDRACPQFAGQKIFEGVTKENYNDLDAPYMECVIPFPEQVEASEDDDGEGQEGPRLYEGTEIPARGYRLLGRDGTPVHPPLPERGHTASDGPLQLEGVWYYPATVVSASPDDSELSVVYDAMCTDPDTGETANCVDEHLSRDHVYIDTFGRGPLDRGPGAVTWRVPDAPAAPVFGTITETTVEVHWNVPPFDGNTNHESLYADPLDSVSGGVVLGYRLFMQRYDDSTGLREEWIELDIAYLGTNTTHVVTNLDADVVYVFTVVATNIVGDSAHSMEAEAPITLEAPIPNNTVASILRPLVPEIQPRSLASAPHKLACSNVPTTLLATTTGGGTNVRFEWQLWREYTELTTIPPVYADEEIWVEYPVDDPELIRAFYLNGHNVTIFDNNSGVVYQQWMNNTNDTLVSTHPLPL